MKLWTGIGVVAVVGLAVTGPYVTGNKTEQGYQHLIDSIKKTPGVSITENKYHKGYLHSSAMTGLSFVDVSGDGKDISFEIKTDFSHGLLSTTSKSVLVIDQETRKELKPFIGEKDPITVKGKYSIWGGVKVNAESIEVDHTDEKSHVHLHLNPFKMDLKLPANLKSYTVKGHWKGLSIDGIKSDSMIINDLSFSQKAEKLTDNIWAGSGAMKLDSLEFTQSGQDSIFLSDFKMTSKTIPEGKGYFSSLTRFSLAKLNLVDPQNKTLNTSVKDQVFELDFKKVSLKELDELLALSDEFKKADLIKDPAEQLRAQMSAMNQLILKSTALLNKGIEINIPELAFSNKGGQAKSSLSLIQLPGAWNANSANHSELLDKTQGSLHVDIPVKMLAGFPKQKDLFKQELDNLVSKDIMLLKDGHYVLNASLKSKIVNLNGKEMPLPQF
jgi:uncharacterized protein YdgA (DUF945 family)